MNTVQREPRSTGACAFSPSPGELCGGVAHGTGRSVSMKEPQPEEQASFSMMPSISTVFDVEALDVLPADVQNKVHLGAEVPRRREVGDRLHQRR